MILGGIFVIEALSVAIQVFAFQTFRKRVFLMAPIHHHFELHGLVGDEDHPALLDHRRGLQRGRLHDLPAEHPIVPRDCASPGRRFPAGRTSSSGWRARGSRRRWRCARGARTWSAWTPARRDVERLRAAGVEVHLDELGDHLLDARPHARQEPWRAAGRAVVRAARERGLEVVGELELAWRLDPERVHRGDRDQRQDDDDGADRPHPPRGRAAGRGRGQRRHRRLIAGRRRWTRTRSSSARPRPSSWRTRRRSRPRQPCC